MTTSPTALAAIIGTADQFGVDPLTALATALAESGLNPTAVGDQGTSFGLFQLHQGGELGSLTPAQAFDPYINAGVALSNFASVAGSDPGLSPAALAAAAQRPADPTAYAATVNANYQTLSADVGQPPPPSSSGFSSWLSKAWDALKSGIGLQAGLATGGAVGGPSAGSAAAGALSGLTSAWAKEALRIGLEMLFVLGGLALLVLGAERMFPGVTRSVVSGVTGAAKSAPLLAA